MAEIQSLILIEDDSDENGEIGNTHLDCHSDSEDTEEYAPVTISSNTSLPIAIPELTHQNSTSGTQINDIGKLISSKSVAEIDVCMNKLSNSCLHVKPCTTALPSRFSDGYNRKSNADWLKKYSWLRYSPTLNAVFYGPCSVLISSAIRVNGPFFRWVKYLIP